MLSRSIVPPNSATESPVIVQSTDDAIDEETKLNLSLDWKKVDVNKSASAWELPVLDEGEQSNHLVKAVFAKLQEAHEEGSPEKTAEAWNALGLVRLHTRQNPEGALECHEMSLRFCQDDPMSKAITLNDIGLCYERTMQCQKAIQIYQQALELLNDHMITESNHHCKQSLERTLARLLRT
jgi:tetratricopeptide (TPR) repeat protein